MDKHEQNLYNALMITYEGNLRFLSQYDNDLFQRVSMLSDLIGSGDYTERYFLEFVKENGDFDIYDSHTSSYIYDRKPKQWNNKAVVNTNFDLNNVVTFINPRPYTEQNTDISEKDLHLSQLYEFKTMTDIQNFRNLLNVNLYNKDKKPKTFKKLIFLGTLLGRHIPKLLKKFNSLNHFVCEHNLEIFRLSLFVCDYSLLAREGRSVVFSIMDDEVVFMDKFRLFFQNDITNNLFYKYFSTDYNVDNYLNLIISNVTQRDPFLFNYNLTLANIIKQSLRKIKEYKTIKLTLDTHNNILENHPVLYLGAGPSLGKNIEWIKQNQDKFIIVAMGATLKRLASNGIKPDIITSLDPAKNAILQQFQVDSLYIENSIKLASTNSDDSVLKKLSNNNSKLFLFEIFKSFYPNGIGLNGLSIGEVTLGLLLLLNAKEIFLLGTDLAFNQVSGDSHDSMSQSVGTKQFDMSEESLKRNSIENKKSFSLRDDVVVVKGNLAKLVKTSRLFYASLHEYNSCIQSFKKPTQTIYNLCEDGAYIEQTLPCRIGELELKYPDIDKSILSNELMQSLDKICFSTDDFTHNIKIEKEISTIHFIIEVIKNIEQTNINKYETFEQKTSRIFYDLLNINGQDSFLPEIYLNYYLSINNYLNYYFNDKNIKDEAKLVKEIQYIWCKRTILLFEEYLKYLQDFVDSK